MKKILIIFTLLLIVVCHNVQANPIILDSNNKYIVNAVRAEGASFENEQSTKKIALSQAKQLAFSELINYLKLEEATIDELSIDTMISSYTIVDEYYNENFYSLIANFTFDKEILKAFFNKKKQNNDTEQSLNYVILLEEKDDIINEYTKLRNFLKKEKIKYHPIKIEATKINILIEHVNKNYIYNSLKTLGVNGQIYQSDL